MRSFRERRPWLVGITCIVLIAAGVAGAFSINRFQGLRGVYTLSADVADAAGLQPGNEVRVAGVKVGTVKRVKLQPDAARVDMEILDDVRIPLESSLEVKLKTLLGQKFVDLQMPRAYVEAAAAGGDPDRATEGYYEAGAVIPLEQTSVPFEIYEAANKGTAVLEGIDKQALRDLIEVLDETVGASKEELGRALDAVGDAGEVLADHSGPLKRLLRQSAQLTGTLSASGSDIDGILLRSADVLEVLAERRATISSLLAATEDLSKNLGVLIRASKGSIEVGTADLNSILVLATGELETIERGLAELGTAQEMFGQPLRFGRFVEGHVCSITTADTCVPSGSPEQPGLPVHGTEPDANEKALDRRLR
ncbi:MAG TPA: MlaD family protein [Actinomycetota bacterium]|nr:MlaD family protein [Actinomycetota bacterium]